MQNGCMWDMLSYLCAYSELHICEACAHTFLSAVLLFAVYVDRDRSARPAVGIDQVLFGNVALSFADRAKRALRLSHRHPLLLLSHFRSFPQRRKLARASVLRPACLNTCSPFYKVKARYVCLRTDHNKALDFNDLSDFNDSSFEPLKIRSSRRPDSCEPVPQPHFDFDCKK